jgi:hypothetical protein
MSEKATKRYEKMDNKRSEDVGAEPNPDSVYDPTRPQVKVKSAGPKDREGSVIKDDLPESITKENASSKNNDAKLRTKSDQEC